MQPQTMLTVKDLDTIEVPPGVKYYELDEGELIPVSHAASQHERIKARTSRLIGRYLDANPVGELYTEASFILSERLERIPDLALVFNERLLHADPHQMFHFAPDLAIEIISPSETGRMMERKVRQFLADGTQEFWQFYPEDRFVRVHTAKAIYNREGDDLLETPLLPALSIKVSSLFP